MLKITRSLLSFFFFLHLAATNTSASKREPHTNFPERQLPRLTAITVRSDIQKRGENFVPKQDCEHHYADHVTILSGDKSRFATTSMKYRLPALILEDIEMDIAEIQCSDTAITVDFANQQTLEVARKSWDNISEFLIISSHVGCNEDGERAPYLVSSISYAQDIPIVIFYVQPMKWSDAYHSMTVSFGTSEGRYGPDSLRIHDDLRKRQAIPSSVSYPSAPTATPSSNSSVDNISYQVPAGEQIFSLSHGNASVQETVTVSCHNCSIAGTVEITEGVFSVNSSAIKEFQALNFIEHGYFKAVANGVNAHIELDTTLSLSSTQSFDKTLSTVTLPGFQIPGIAAVGPMFQLHLTGSIEIVADLDFTYGFDLVIPDNSSIQLNVGNLSDSTSSGFTDARITGIPFAASSPEVGLILGLGLTAYVLLGIDILSGDGEMIVGMFVDTPHLTVSVTQLAGVNAECEPVTDSSTVNGFLSHIFPNLTHVVPQVGVDVGLTAGVDFNVDEFDIHTSIGRQDTLTGTSWALPTTCLLWNDAKKEFASPTVTSSTAGSTSTGSKPTPTGKGGKAISNMGVRRTFNPISGLSAVWLSCGILLSTLFVDLYL